MWQPDSGGNTTTTAITITSIFYSSHYYCRHHNHYNNKCELRIANKALSRGNIIFKPWKKRGK
ncbi:hypothetical protein E2C01_011522 [Portunus trituberculatus]|uniref:Uncharacterized protein n=1 Tax=Portunus trituberculatus TaxID=210409 RepID=A0A5B7DBE9_PORTR|nr:hypothetical protein [Portunus trituberculatus]